MKPAVFDYYAPQTVQGAVELLAAHDDAKVLAGGQSLVPVMSFRLARPATLVDINRIPDLDYVRVNGGVLEIGALARHSYFERTVEPGPLGQLLPAVARWVGHHPIRVRGTFVGSLAHADPAAEWAVLAHTLDATMVAVGPEGERSIGAASFFQTYFSTSLLPGELLTEVRIPLLAHNTRVGFAEFSRRAGDFALVMALVAIELEGGVVSSARVGLGGVADKPIRSHDAETALIGLPASAESALLAGDAAANSVVPLGDIHGSPEYRTDLVRAMVRRACAQAFEL